MGLASSDLVDALVRSRWRIATAVLLLIAILVVASGLTAGFVSDAWIFLARADGRSIGDILVDFTRVQPGNVYRPFDDLAFWLQYQAFGLNALPYHLVALAAHLGTSVAIGAIALQTTGKPIAALAATGAVALSMHAHEVVYDAADIHNAVGGLLLSTAVLAFIRGANFLAAAIMVGLFTVDETGLLVLPLVTLYVIVFRGSPRSIWPIAVLTGAFVAIRLLGGGFGGEVIDPCRTPSCLAAGAQEYVRRFLIRPDTLVVQRTVGTLFALATVAIVLLLRPWRWTTWPAILFGAGWAAGATMLLLLGLYPYVADRFLYVPSMGAAIVIGALVAEASQRLREGPVARLGATIALVAIGAWVVAGALILQGRGGAWVAAGARAASIIEATYALVPDPPPGSCFVFSAVPHSNEPIFPPGNTGPYVFHNGLSQALALRYGRADLVVLEPEERPLQTCPIEDSQRATHEFHLTVEGWNVVLSP